MTGSPRCIEGGDLSLDARSLASSLRILADRGFGPNGNVELTRRMLAGFADAAEELLAAALGQEERRDG